jgi:glycosyltransferase involved in cell wall biosynthesis
VPTRIEPLVTVVLPVWNREGSVARAITSVLQQTYRHFEIIVVDDGSTDGTRRAVDAFGADVRLLTQPHRGVYAARNLALRHASGDLIAFIDSDDVWLPHRLASQVPLMSRDDVGLVFGDAIHVLPDGQPVRQRPRSSFRVSPPQRGRVAGAFARSNFVPTITVLVRRRCLEEIGGFSESMQLSADYLTWFRISLRHELDYVDAPVAEYTINPDGLSYDLGTAVAARIALFSEELARTDDRQTRALLRRLLFNLSLHLAIAAARGRARKTAHPLRLARRTAFANAGIEAAPWTASFALHQLQLRTRRIFA